MLVTNSELEKFKQNKNISTNAQIRKDGFLLTLGNFIQTINKDSSLFIDPFNEKDLDHFYGEKKSNWSNYMLEANEFILFSTNETFNMGNQFFGLIITLTHVARLGIMTNLTSNYVDRYFEGELTLEVKNMTNHRFKLHKNMPVGKLIVFHLDTNNDEKLQEKEGFTGAYREKGELSSKYPQLFGVDLRGV